jgi:DNA-binding IclR family transcriptional regulator
MATHLGGQVLAVEQTKPACTTDGSGLDTSVGKAIAVLDAFRGDGALLGVSQIAERSCLPKSTAHRLLTLLVEHGYLERAETRYRLSRAIFELGSMISECRPRSMRAIAMPFMAELYEATHATVHLAVLDGLDVLYVEKIYGHNGVDLPSRVGGRVPALCTALGKAILAFSSPGVVEAAFAAPIPRLTARTMTNPAVLRQVLERARQTGIADDNEGASIGARCLAAPVLSRDNSVLGAVSLSFPTSERVSTMAVHQLKRSAALIGARVERQERSTAPYGGGLTPQSRASLR